MRGCACRSLSVRIDDAGDDPGQNLAHLGLVASHQDRIFERFLSELAQFREVLIQHLDLFDARNRFALRRPPDREFLVFAAGHVVLYLGALCGASPSPGFFWPPGCEKII